MNFIQIHSTRKKSITLLKLCACRALNNYSPVTISELCKYLYVDEKKISRAELENELCCRDSSFKKINIPRLKFLMKVLRKQTAYKDQLSQARKDVYQEVKTLQSIMDPPNKDIIDRIARCENKKTLILRHREVLNQYYDALNSLVMEEYLSVPNDIHKNTPIEETNVIFRSERIPSSVEDHLVMGKKLNVLRYHNSSHYYLMNDGALLELATMRYFADTLKKENFRYFLNPDTCNNFIIDGASDGTSQKFFKLQGNKYSLVGTSSLSSFCALRVGQSTHSKYLPERSLTYGRHYTPQTKFNTEDGLYSVFQRSNVHIFTVTESSEQMEEEFHKTLELLRAIYEQANLDFRISYQAANKLLLGESLRANIELYSIHLKTFVEVAHLSVYGNFISKRMLMLCHDKNQNYKFLNLVEGVAVSYPVLLAYLLERSDGKKLDIPGCLQSFMYHKVV